MANRRRKPEARSAPTRALRDWMARKKIDNAALSRMLAAVGCETTPDGVRQIAHYRMPGHKLASALSVVTGLPYARFKPPAEFSKVA